jgi:hypothetical protein
MAEKKPLTSSALRDRLSVLADSSTKVGRATLAQGLSRSYRKLLADVAKAAGKDGPPLTEAASARRFATNVAKLVAENDPRRRQEMARALADEYTTASQAREEQKRELLQFGGRGGDVVYDGAREGFANERLDRAMAALRDRRSKADVLVVAGAGGVPAECAPQRITVTVEKPGAPGVAAAGLDPEFAAWLAQEGSAHLGSIGEWIAHENAGDPQAPTDANRRAYDAALAQAYARFERALNEDRYCTPQDLPMPGGQRGHRLLRLPVPLAEADFRDDGCGSRIYEGPLGAPVAPELDYAELVRRYVQFLKPLPRSFYDLESINEAEIQLSHTRDLGGVDPQVVRLFVEASRLALGNAAFVRWLTQLAQA